MNFGWPLLVVVFFCLFLCNSAITSENESDVINYASKMAYTNFLDAFGKLGEKVKECKKQETALSPSPRSVANLLKSIDSEKLRLALIYHSIKNAETCAIEEEKNVLAQIEKINSIYTYIKDFRGDKLEKGNIKFDPEFLNAVTQARGLLSSFSISSLKIQASYHLKVPEKEKVLIKKIPGINEKQFNPLKIMEEAEKLAGDQRF